MKTQYTLYTQVQDCYQEILTGIEAAQDRISMMYYTFDFGEWSGKIAERLVSRAAAGVEVRLMVDEFGLILDQPRHTLVNHILIRDMREAGVEVVLFRPDGHRLNPSHRLHLKICAVDNHTAFVGGSNIGDHYLGWDDNNLRLVGALGGTFHDVYDYVKGFTPDRGKQPVKLHLSRLFAGEARVLLTVPKQRFDIRRALLDIILDADQEIFIRNWYFLPDREILNGLRSQAQHGVGVNVLLSHKTRVRLIDAANYIHCHKLAKSGGTVYRFTRGYMHAKVAWNNRGDVLFGSANMDSQAMNDNFECSIVFNDPDLARELQEAFKKDAKNSLVQTPDLFRKRGLHQRALAYTCNLAAPWL